MQKMVWFGVVRGHSRSWAMPPFDRANTTSCLTLLETMCLSFTVFDEIQPDICRKSPILTHTHLHLAPPQGVTPVEFRGDLWRQKTRVPGVSCGVVCVILRLAVLVEHRLVTDRQTQGHGQYRGCIASRVKNLWKMIGLPQRRVAVNRFLNNFDFLWEILSKGFERLRPNCETVT